VKFTGKDANLVPQQVFEDLMVTNEEYRLGFWQGRSRKPTIRLVHRGTFAKYRKWKCDKGNISMTQLKVPVVLSDQTSKEWFLQKVVREL